MKKIIEYRLAQLKLILRGSDEREWYKVDDFPFRLATSPLRSLPNFIIIGAMKSGTTSLHHYLEQHPSTCLSLRKEVHFFDSLPFFNLDIPRYPFGLLWYRAFFPKRMYLKRTNKITGETSPSYLFDLLSPKRIAKLLPNIKLIVILRNPVDRAISHYSHLMLFSPLGSLEEELKNEDLLPMDYASQFYKSKAYKRRGHYAEQLARYFQYFNRDQILVLNSDDLYANPLETINEVCRFLNIRMVNKGDIDFIPHNPSKHKANVSKKTKDELSAYFAPHNKKLYQLIGKDFGW